MSKKTLKRTGVAVLSMAMLMSMGAVAATTASAANGDFTVNKPSDYATLSTELKGEIDAATFDVYKVADDSNNFVSPFDTAGVTLAQLRAASTNSTEAKTYAAKFASKVTSSTAKVQADKALGTNVTLANGYYLVMVKSSATSDMLIQPIMVYVNDNDPDDATLKYEHIDLTKEIKLISGVDQSHTADTGEVKVGDVVSYELNTTFPTYAPEVTDMAQAFTITDATTVGLTDDETSVQVFINGSATALENTGNANYTVTPVAATGSAGRGFTITFEDDFVLAHPAQSVKVTYTATVNSSATTLTTANTNTATLTFGHDYLTGGSPKSKSDETNVYSAVLNVYKTGSDGAVLDGVTFTLQDADGNYIKADGTRSTGTLTAAQIASDWTLSTSVAGMINFTKLDCGTYTLTETATKPGYRLPTTPVTFTISPAVDGVYDGQYQIVRVTNATVDGTAAYQLNIVNPKPDALPGTGGIGTVIFTVGGASIVLLAGVMFVLYMRKRKAEEE